jgi:DNA-binding transcriptional ArsR family regulator
LTRIYLEWHIDGVPEALWSVLTDPNRRAVLDLLRDRPRSVTELVDQLGLSQPATSKHLRVLREAGFVRVERDAQRRIYVLEPAPLAELDGWLAPYRHLWNDRLDALGRRLASHPRTTPRAASRTETTKEK